MVYSLKKKDLITIYKTAHLIRSTEERIANEYPKGEIRCPTHLSIGQEFVPSILSLFISKNDYCVSTHRGHAHYIAKGGSLYKFIAEIYGKETGCSKGKGGSMHLIDKEAGFMGTSAIVGNSIPTGVGLALHIKLRKLKSLAIVYLGEGATEEGVFYESINFAALKNLPVLFICENNLYSVYSPLSVRQPKKRNIKNIMKSMGIDSYKCDGNNIDKCFKILKHSIPIVRKNRPVFIEFTNYRWREHCGPYFDNNIGYRSEKEFLKWKKRDPMKKLEQYFISNSLKENLYKIQKQNFNIIEKSFKFAKSSKFPHPQKAFTSPYK